MFTPHEPSTRLDERLSELARQPIPLVRPTLRADVWREIHRRSEPNRDWMEALIELFWRPSLAIPGFAFVIAMGIFFGAFSAKKSDYDIQLARQSLYLDVFAPNASGLPTAVVVRE